MLASKTPERWALVGGKLFSNWRLTRKILRAVSERSQSQNSVWNFVCPRKLWTAVHSSDARAARLAIGLTLDTIRGSYMPDVLFWYQNFRRHLSHS